MKVTVVIPAYNESKRISSVLEELVSTGLPVIVVDDGSRDKTQEGALKYPVTVLKHKINLGKGAAIKTGCKAAFLNGAEAVIVMDADGQHKVNDLERFISALEKEKYDIVFGSRNWVRGIPLVRFLGNKFASVLVNLLFKIYISDLICGYRGFTKKAFMKMKLESVGYEIETEMVVRTGREHLKYCEVSVETVYYDKFKGVSIMDSFGVLLNVLKWKFNK
jgi:glycosyltransferase involved in cell wall biosynthesis